MQKLKNILPSLKEKKRYISFHVTGTQEQDVKNVQEAIDAGVLNFLGEYGTAQAGTQVLMESSTQGIVKVHPAYTAQTITALALIHHIHTDPVRISTIRTSGILAKSKRRN